ncbi:hypothetical protein BASA61_009176 [Batrachochytrium salamandrivorans]|nr:hypothetical protein BASA61_009176 [Batrachochytrium salamandrivorans]
MIDMEEGVIKHILKGPLREIFDGTQHISSVSGSGNNWAVGHHVYGPQFQDEILERVRKQAEYCDSLQSFFLIGSMGGGTGSGLGSYLIGLLEDQFPSVYRFVSTIIPSPNDDVVTSPYNSVLSLHKMAQSADCVLPVDNQSLSAIYERILARSEGGHQGRRKGSALTDNSALAYTGKIKNVTLNKKGDAFDTMNNLVANLLLNMTSSMRFEGAMNVDINDIVTNLVPFPQLKYLFSSMTPLYALTDIRIQPRSLDQMFTDAFSRESQLVCADPKSSVYLASALIVRGAVEISDMRRNIDRMRKTLRFVPWNADGWKTGLCDVPPIGQPHSLLSLSNNCCIHQVFDRMDVRFGKLYRRKANIHHYLEYMEQQEFMDARESLRSTVSEYRKHEASLKLSNMLDISDAPQSPAGDTAAIASASSTTPSMSGGEKELQIGVSAASKSSKPQAHASGLSSHTSTPVVSVALSPSIPSVTLSPSTPSTTSGVSTLQRKRSSVIPARSHYAKRLSQDLSLKQFVRDDGSDSMDHNMSQTKEGYLDVAYSLSSKEVRQQSLSWTERELHLSSQPSSLRSPMRISHNTRPVAPMDPAHANSSSSPDPIKHHHQQHKNHTMGHVSLLSQQVITHRPTSSSSLSPNRPYPLSIVLDTTLDGTLNSPTNPSGYNSYDDSGSDYAAEDTSPLLPIHTPCVPSHHLDFSHPPYDQTRSHAYHESLTPSHHGHPSTGWWQPHSHFRLIRDNAASVAWTGVGAIPAVCLGVTLSLLDAMSYGIIIFPASNTYVPESAAQSGISMFLASTMIAQIVLTEMQGASDHAIIATIMAAYSLSTILTGVVFIIIGIFKLGNLVQFFPRHILVGCIGGIGLFLLFTGIEVTADIQQEFTMEYLRRIFEWTSFKLWGASLAAALLLKAIQRYVSHTLLVPMFYLSIPIIFYTITFSFGMSLDMLRTERWLFDLPSSEDIPFWTYFTYLDFFAVDWRAVAATLPTQMALIFFGILHVPINVPALAVSTKQDVELSSEIIGHGISNIAAGLIASPQNYLVYSNSLLYIRSGGGSRIGGVLLSLATIALWIKGGSVIGYVPTIVVGSLIFHLGIDLLLESVVHTWIIGINPFEYITILIIVGVMGGIGFTEGIVAGIILACIFFVVMCSRRFIIRESFSGLQLRSTVHRLYRQQMFLDNCGDQIHVIKLQGFMFFGTINQLETHILGVFRENAGTKFVLIDFALINGIDYSALESFQRIRRVIFNHQSHLVFCGLGALHGEVMKSGVFDAQEDDDDLQPFNVHNFATLNGALEWCENLLLEIYYCKSNRPQLSEGICVPAQTKNQLAVPDEHPQFATPRLQRTHAAASFVLKEHPHNNSTRGSVARPVSVLLQAFSEGSSFESLLGDLCGSNFELIEVQSGETLYTVGDEATELYVIEEGELVMVIPEKRDGERVVETLLPGTMVGEMDMFTGRQRVCRLYATQDALVWRLSKVSFDTLCQEYPDVMLTFVTKIALSFDAVRYHNTLKHWAQLR